MIRASYAADPAKTRGRLHPDTPDGGRDPFARDRDRLIHSSAFRRLRDKTQVFVAPDGDHFRVRLTHSLEVAQIARSMARRLRLHEDLTEVLALGHDIGHPPFGHAGEDALSAAMAACGGFDHNGHAIRILTALEHRTPAYDGLNMTWETLEGLAKHNGPVAAPQWALAQADAAWPLDLHTHAGLEAQVATLADDIAYDAHDLDDGVRAGLITVEEAAAAVPWVGDLWRGVTGRWPGETKRRRLMPHLVRDVIGVLLDDVVAVTEANLAEHRPPDADAIRGAGRPTAAFSPAAAAMEAELKSFLRARMYANPQVQRVRAPAAGVIGALFSAMLMDPDQLPDRWREHLPADPVARARHVGDYIAGMTDRFALREHARLIGPAKLGGDA